MLLGNRQQSVPVILRELVLPDGFDPVSPSFTFTDVTTELSGPINYLDIGSRLLIIRF
ncbi:unnamed protein product [Schistosoma curassoni]|uniref:Uncharacterized protein n=1 Tax=Schistosoma curassoni TaxID=6186 RepID=A0A183K466_9TREM|nr:unnamed protein product [Schistosoma curassoni]